MDEGLRRLINKEANIDRLGASAIKAGMTSLLDNAIQLALKGETTVQEVLKAGYTLG